MTMRSRPRALGEGVLATPRTALALAGPAGDRPVTAARLPGAGP